MTWHVVSTQYILSVISSGITPGCSAIWTSIRLLSSTEFKLEHCPDAAIAHLLTT